MSADSSSRHAQTLSSAFIMKEEREIGQKERTCEQSLFPVFGMNTALDSLHRNGTYPSRLLALKNSTSFLTAFSPKCFKTIGFSSSGPTAFKSPKDQIAFHILVGETNSTSGSSISVSVRATRGMSYVTRKVGIHKEIYTVLWCGADCKTPHWSPSPDLKP